MKSQAIELEKTFTGHTWQRTHPASKDLEMQKINPFPFFKTGKELLGIQKEDIQRTNQIFGKGLSLILFREIVVLQYIS